jgi:cytoskeleton protein RodZ
MASVGAHLRELRTRRGISLEEISRSTRVLTQYLEALETDRYEALPAPVFTKGFIRAYCQALGVPPDESLAIYEGRPGGGTDAKPAPREPRPAQPAGVSEATAKRHEAAENRTRGAVLAGFVLLVVLGVALFAVTLWLHPAPAPLGGERPEEPQAAPPVPALPAAEAPRPLPAPAAPAPPVGAPSVEARAAIVGVTSPYRLIARTSEATWMRVRTEDGRTSEENIPAGETREWVSNRPFVLTIGNAGGVALELNGRSVPRLGPSGAVIERLVLPSDAR